MDTILAITSIVVTIGLLLLGWHDYQRVRRLQSTISAIEGRSRNYSCLRGHHCWMPNGGSDNGWYCEKCLHCTAGRAVCVTSCPEPGVCENLAAKGERLQ